MKVKYFDNGKHAIFDGTLFCCDENTGYYLNSNTHKRLHRAVWEYYNGSIPDGYHIHHIDHNKQNNELSNLKIVTKEEHHKIHAEEMTDEQRNRLRQNLDENARPKALEWHGSENGRLWHKNHYEDMKEKLYFKKSFVCEECGKKFEAVNHGVNRFCSGACRAANRRKSGADDETRKCEWCDNEFTTNKYSKARTCCRSCRNFLRWNKGDPKSR